MGLEQTPGLSPVATHFLMSLTDLLADNAGLPVLSMFLLCSYIACYPPGLQNPCFKKIGKEWIWNLGLTISLDQESSTWIYLPMVDQTPWLQRGMARKAWCCCQECEKLLRPGSSFWVWESSETSPPSSKLKIFWLSQRHPDQSRWVVVL